ncbi:contractile injection system tape measure protein, partial [Plesiocystis pacifica]|uniref:contractile injection system tape measure protein n=1 Tax=Plesiocystis pacifica TaxID=191768 RepID=UPI0022B616A6
VVEEAARGHLSGPEAEGVVRRSLDMVADVVAAHGLLGRAALGAAVVEGVFGAGAAETEGALSSTTTEAAALLSALDWARVSPQLGARASRAVRARERAAAEAQGAGASAPTEATTRPGPTEATAPAAGEDLRRRREEEAPVQGVSAALRRLVRALVDGHAARADSEGSEASTLPALPPASAQPEALQRSILALARALLAQRPTPAALRGQLEWLASPAAAELPQPWREALLVELNASLTSAAGSPASGRGPAAHTPRPTPDRGEPAPARRVPPRGLAELLDQGGLAVEDAGLVMLWPFLERLLQRLELVDPESRTFPHLRAQTLGARLLHALARGPAAYAEDPPEFTMTLPKLLCGLEPDAPLDPDGLAEALPATFLDEGERLLEAVLGHAEGLGLRGVDGLRGSFLLRGGVLVSRDGAWLLRVAGEAYDLLLARVPWSWSWVSLPWMAEPLRVEW